MNIFYFIVDTHFNVLGSTKSRLVISFRRVIFVVDCPRRFIGRHYTFAI